jgi:hypothetical protein
MRSPAIEGTDMDSEVADLAAGGVRLYPLLGLPCPAGTVKCTEQTTIPVATAASEMASYVRAFALRYGPGGSFWAAHPSLPYVPVESFEIGDEPNIQIYYVADETHLHWEDPSDGALADYADYAQVYVAARAALHAVDPSGVAVVGGLADSASNGVDVQSDERLLAALPRGGVDAVGYHPWVFDVSDSLLEPDTSALRTWMDANGFAGVPLDVNEFGACAVTAGATDNGRCSVSQSSAAWGSVVVSYAQWALCTPWVDVEKVMPFYWGATPAAAEETYLSLVGSDGSLTPYGQDFLGLARTLTTTGCPGSSISSTSTPPANTTPPSIAGTAAVGEHLTGDPGVWTGDPTPTLSYQWEQCDPAGDICSSIGNGTTYTVQPTDVGDTIVFSVTGINTVQGLTATSPPTAVVPAVSTGTSGEPGAGTQGQTGTPQTGAAGGKPATNVRLASMGLRIVRVLRHGETVSVTVSHRARSGTVLVNASTRGRRPKHRSLRGRRRTATTTVFTAQLASGRWTIVVSGTPASGFARPAAERKTLTVPSPRSSHVVRRSLMID